MIRQAMPRCLAFCLLSVVVIGGCNSYSQQQGQSLEARLQKLEKRQAEIDVSRARQEQTIAELEAVLEKATAVVKRNSADLGTRVEEITKELQAIEGKIAELRNDQQRQDKQALQDREMLEVRVRDIARKAGLDVPVDPSKVPASKTAHFQQAKTSLSSGDHSMARALFREFVRKYPRDEEADDAQYYIGLSYFRQGKPSNAITEFGKVLRNYQAGDVVDQTLLDLANAFFELRNCEKAKASADAIVARKRDSKLIRKARSFLRMMRRAPSSACDG